jgi:hypothetical protein
VLFAPGSDFGGKSDFCFLSLFLFSGSEEFFCRGFSFVFFQDCKEVLISRLIGCTVLTGQLLPDLVHKPSFKSVFSCSRGKRTTSLQLAPLSPFSFSSLIFLTGGSQSIYRNFDPLTSETAIASKQGTVNPCGGSHWGEVGVCAESGEKHPVC